MLIAMLIVHKDMRLDIQSKPKKLALFLSVDNLATVSCRKTCDLSIFCL